ncbi:MAG: MBL fold metallo-hydrolase [Chloroflexi bacterium]|nr:MBL fold metallo-hydrolase [Chloroflexota bacterium]
MAQIDLITQGFTANSDQARLALSTVALVRTGKHNIIVDAAHYGRRNLMDEGIRKLGLRPEDIDILFLTHLHWDHMQNVDLFPNATIYTHPREFEYVHNPKPSDWATMRYVPGALAGREIKQVTEGHQIADDVRVIETPGHTIGHMSLIVETSAGRTGIIGDALPNARTTLARMPYLIIYDKQAARESAEKIVASCDVFYCGHDRPFRLEGDKVNYLTEQSIRFTVLFDPQGNDQSVTLAASPPAAVLVVE